MSHYRCRKCRKRQRLGKAPHLYVRKQPKCKGCGARNWVLDRYRAFKERNSKVTKLCQCNQYHYHHRKGSGFCEHNTYMTDRQRMIREGLDPDKVQPIEEENNCPF